MPKKTYKAWFQTTQELGTCQANSEAEARKTFESWLDGNEVITNIKEVKRNA